MKTTTLPNACTWALLLAWLGGCASPVPQTSSSSNWLTCETLDDCAAEPTATACTSGYCVDSSGRRFERGDAPAAGGKTASGGAGGRTGAGGFVGSGGRGSVVGTGGEPSYCAVIGNSDLDEAAIASLFGDAASTCTLDVSNYSRSCVEDIDCVEVGVGNACQTPCEVLCSNAAISVADKARYDADFAASPLAACTSSVCHCPCAGGARCAKGQCELVSCAETLDAGPP